MTTMTHEQVVHIIGPAAGESVILEIVGTGATVNDLEEAVSWLYADDAMTEEHRHQPRGVVGELIEILSRAEVEIERD